ncbi:MAG: tetratricopeptide repeat protein, partial [Pseudomonadota bacterium]|nr:tetratricopeptide repeat protein [Pseudomonadota bacterium]
MSIPLAETMRRIGSLLQAGRYREAQLHLESLVRANPQHVEGLRLLAGTTQALGDLGTAESLLRRALELDPSWTPTLTSLGELLMTAGRGMEGILFLQRAIQGMPRYPRAAFVLARHYLDTGRPAAALDVASPWCQGVNVDADLCALQIAAYGALGRHAEAVAQSRRLAARAADDPNADHMLATALIAANEAEEGERIMRRTLAHTRPTAALHLTHARSLIALQRFEQAEVALRACVELEPRRADAHDSLAQLIWMRTGDITEATSVLDQALARFDHEDALWATKAALLQGAGDARGAYACLAMRAARPQAPPALLIRAGLAALDFEPANALALAERALLRQPDDPAARKLRCAAFLGVGDGAKALGDCTSLLRSSPDDQYLIAMQTTALRLLNDPRYDAFCDYTELVVSQPLAVPAGWASLGEFLRDLGARLQALHNPHGHRLLYQSLRLGTETTQDLSRSTDPIIRALFEAFAAPIARYREHIGQGPDALRRRNHGASRFNGAWSVRLHRGGYHASHVHPRGWISSACYIELPNGLRRSRTDEGILCFGAPGLITTPRLHAELSVRPEVGQLILFPSYFWHGTLAFAADRPRLTVAFDVVPEGLPSRGREG